LYVQGQMHPEHELSLENPEPEAFAIRKSFRDSQIGNRDSRDRIVVTGTGRGGAA
jgi:hypothetical protein